MFCSSPEPAVRFYFLGPRMFFTQKILRGPGEKAVPTGMPPPQPGTLAYSVYTSVECFTGCPSAWPAEIPFGNRLLVLSEGCCAFSMSFYCKAEPLTCDSLRIPNARVLVILYSAGFYCSISKFKLLFYMFFSF